ncbi:hypothetical protein [Salipiger abyssi]|uniref:hypothetical protein n=1 Tax=Salipiger abyssi TaxID=1250539 RepID=UPI001A8F0B01|nr:hypothetical protein [Salipiger abyssi]MBN9889315.1 hypothetical protein [Salipiger abyssi]
MFPQSVLIGLVVALVGYFLQQRSWRHNKREEVRQREFEACTKVIEDLARAFDKRILATSEFVSCVNRGDATEDELQHYRNSVRDWMHEFSSFKSRIFHFFGKEKMLEFENSVHEKIRKVSDIALRTNRYGKKNLSAAHRDEQEAAQRRLDVARYAAYRLLADLNEMTANEETSRISLYDNIRVGHLDMISRTYLIQRLLNLKS